MTMAWTCLVHIKVVRLYSLMLVPKQYSQVAVVTLWIWLVSTAQSVALMLQLSLMLLRSCLQDSAAVCSNGKFFKVKWTHLYIECLKHVGLLVPNVWSLLLFGYIKFVNALTQILAQHLTPKIQSDVNGLMRYCTFFKKCIFMVSLWPKIFHSIELRNLIMQARQSILDIQLNQIHMLIEEMMDVRRKFDAIWEECEQVAQAIRINIASNMMHDYKTNVFLCYHWFSDRWIDKSFWSIVKFLLHLFISVEIQSYVKQRNS